VISSLAEVNGKYSLKSGSTHGQGKKTMTSKKKMENFVLWTMLPVRTGSRVKNLGQLRRRSFIFGAATEEWQSKNKTETGI